MFSYHFNIYIYLYLHSYTVGTYQSLTFQQLQTRLSNKAEVKNQDILIQGRYGTTKFTVDGQSALLELAISGNFISNDTIIIQPMNGTLAPAGKIVLKDFLGKKKRMGKRGEQFSKKCTCLFFQVFFAGLDYPAMWEL